MAHAAPEPTATVYAVELFASWDDHPGEWKEITGQKRFATRGAAERWIWRHLAIWRIWRCLFGPAPLNTSIAYRVVPGSGDTILA